MRQATTQDKHTIIDILCSSFADNKSVNYVIPNGPFQEKRLRELMEYSFAYCQLFGQVLISEDGKACALVMFPDRKKTTLRSILLDINLAIRAIGFRRLSRAMKREAAIKRQHPNSKIIYLWFIGVRPEAQNRGIGSALLHSVIEKNEISGRPMYLETSCEQNIPFYKKFGFKIYNELDFGYKLYCLKRGH
jgi:ribosomal protein S18 acetylase RimI-like enzyme